MLQPPGLHAALQAADRNTCSLRTGTGRRHLGYLGERHSPGISGVRTFLEWRGILNVLHYRNL
jgi:hypothetical protein